MPTLTASDDRWTCDAPAPASVSPIPPRGVPADLCVTALQRAAWSTLRLVDHLGGRLAQRLTRSLHERLQRAILREQLAPRAPLPVARLERDAWSEYPRLALEQRRPVVLAGFARDWPAVREWSFESLAERFADFELDASHTADWDAKQGKSAARRTTLGDAIGRMRAGESLTATFLSLLHAHPELLDDFALEQLGPLRDPGAQLGVSEAFLGAPGTRTPIHCAPTHNLFVQVLGQKRWLLYGPECDPALRPLANRMPYFVSRCEPAAPDAEHPLLPYAQGYAVTLEPGDLLFVPAYWWHEVSNPSLALGVALRWNSVRALFRASVVNSLLALTATRPTLWQVHRAHQRLDFALPFRAE